MIYAYSFKLKITNLRLICGFFCENLREKKTVCFLPQIFT